MGGVKAGHLYTDGAPEFEATARELKIPFDTSQPHVKESNGVIERNVRRVKEGTQCQLVQCGLAWIWWNVAAAYYCFVRCVYDKLECGRTAYEKRFERPFRTLTGKPVPIYPFGCEIRYVSPDPEKRREQHPMGDQMRQGLFP